MGQDRFSLCLNAKDEHGKTGFYYATQNVQDLIRQKSTEFNIDLDES